MKLWPLVLIMTLLTSNAPAVTAGLTMRNFDFKKYLLASEKYRDCPENVKEICSDRTDTSYCPFGIDIKVIYADLIENEPEEAIVQGSSCYTGTAGSDIHSVYKMGFDGTVQELLLPEVDKKQFSVLFGNTNYELAPASKKLFARYSDTSGRANPLVVEYQWKNDRFQINSVKVAPSYKTSYDCSKAKVDQERAICFVKELADLDVKLDSLYSGALRNASGTGKATLIQNQKQWITNRNKNCTIYKWWVECIKKTYEDRIGEIKGHPNSK